VKYFITGITGLIGSNLAKTIIANGDTIVAPVRNLEKAQAMFPKGVELFECVLEKKIHYKGNIDYIIHCASPTASKYFIKNPVETIDTIVCGTKNVLELAVKLKPKSVLYLSSMEVYGASSTDEPITEDKQFFMDPLNVRSSYSMGKRIAETLCESYLKEYHVPIKIARLAQTIGEKILPDDNRVVAQFLRSIWDNKDIEIETDGLSKQTYISVHDSITGILTILTEGKDGEAYNVADTDSYCSILDLAKLIRTVSGSDIKIHTYCGDEDKYPPNRMNKIDNTKLLHLGWSVTQTLEESLTKLWKNR